MQDLNDKVSNGGASSAGKLLHTDWNEVATELQNTIVASGQTLDAGNLAQLLVAVTKMASGQATWCTDSGSGTAYVLTPAYTVSNVLFTGLTLKFRPANNSTIVNPTVNYNGTGVKTIKNEAGDGLVVGDLSTLRDAEIRYDGTDFRLLTRSTNLLLASMYRKGYIQGFWVLKGASNPTYGVQITAGDAADFTATLNLIRPTLIEKRIDQTWVLGTAAGGRPAAVAHSNNTWYRVFVIGGDSALTDAGFDTSGNATNLLAAATAETGNTYNKYRQVGWILTGSSAEVVPFYTDFADVNNTYWEVPIVDATGDDPGNARITGTVTAAPDSDAIISAWIGGNPGSPQSYYMDIRPLEMTDVAASNSNFVLRATDFGSGGYSVSTILPVRVNTSRQLAYRFSGSNANLKYRITTRGFRFMRGAQ